MTKLNVIQSTMTDWQSYTPSLSSWTLGNGTLTGRTRRVGDSSEYYVSLRLGTTSVASGSPVFGLAPGQTTDTAKLSASDNTVGVGWFIDASANTRFTISAFPSGSTGVSVQSDNTGPVSATVPFAWAVGDYVDVFFTLPIVGFSSNVTMGERALEEMAWNTDTTNATNNTAFAYGLGGVLFPNRTVGSEVIKRIRFQTPPQATDRIVFEWKRLSTDAAWNPQETLFPSILQGASIYGIRLTRMNNTDYDVTFSTNGAYSNNATYAGNGLGFDAFFTADYVWRVRKTSGGAAVGYPIGARNVVGDVSGTAVPVGYIGERLTAVNTTANNAVFNTPYSSGTVSLTPGTYDLFGIMALTTFGTLATSSDIRIAVRDTTATTFAGTSAGDNLIVYAVSSGGAGAAIGPWRVNVTTTATYHAVGQVAAASGTGTANLRIIANRVA